MIVQVCPPLCGNTILLSQFSCCFQGFNTEMSVAFLAGFEYLLVLWWKGMFSSSVNMAIGASNHVRQSQYAMHHGFMEASPFDIVRIIWGLRRLHLGYMILLSIVSSPCRSSIGGAIIKNHINAFFSILFKDAG